MHYLVLEQEQANMLRCTYCSNRLPQSIDPISITDYRLNECAADKLSQNRLQFNRKLKARNLTLFPAILK